jgi:hypothetical protein
VFPSTKADKPAFPALKRKRLEAAAYSSAAMLLYSAALLLTPAPRGTAAGTGGWPASSADPRRWRLARQVIPVPAGDYQQAGTRNEAGHPCRIFRRDNLEVATHHKC